MSRGEPALHYSSTGVRSFDAIGATAPHRTTDLYPTVDGIAMLQVLPTGRYVECQSAPLPDHMIIAFVRPPSSLRAAISANVRPFAPRPGEILVAPAGSVVDWHSAKGDGQAVHMHLSTSRLHRSLGDEIVGGRPIELIPQISTADGAISHLLRSAIMEVRSPGLASAAMIESYALELTVRLLRAHSTHAAGRAAAPLPMAPYRLRRAKDFIETHLSEDIGLETMATSAGLSSFHFARMFKKATGKSPYRYLTELRIAKACDMLIGSDQAIAEIATACGFSNQQQFTTTFRRITACTPARYREQARF